MKIHTQESAFLPNTPKKQEEIIVYLEKLSEYISKMQRTLRGDLDNLLAGMDGLKLKIVDIGDWDMDTDGSVSVAHGLDFDDIRFVKATIIRDDSALCADLAGPHGNLNWDATNIIAYRTASGDFDSADYDATSFNRGYLLIAYID